MQRSKALLVDEVRHVLYDKKSVCLCPDDLPNYYGSSAANMQNFLNELVTMKQGFLLNGVCGRMVFDRGAYIFYPSKCQKDATFEQCKKEVWG